MTRRTALGPLAAIATIAVAGCGGGGTPAVTSSGAGAASASGTSPSGTASTSAVTRAQFSTRAEALCKQLSSAEKPLKARQETLKSLPAASASAAFVSLAHQVVALSRATEAKLRAVPRPPGDTVTIEKLLGDYGEEIADVSNIAYDIVHQENSAGEAAAAALKRTTATAVGLAEGFGLKECIGGE